MFFQLVGGHNPAGVRMDRTLVQIGFCPSVSLVLEVYIAMQPHSNSLSRKPGGYGKPSHPFLGWLTVKGKPSKKVRNKRAESTEQPGDITGRRSHAHFSARSFLRLGRPIGWHSVVASRDLRVGLLRMTRLLGLNPPFASAPQKEKKLQ